jgi:iron complex transport system substrate-binding protein
MKSRLARWGVCLLLPWLALPAALAGTVTVEAGWARPTPPGMTVAAGYLVLRNDGNAVEHLTALGSPQAASVELHESQLSGGVARMRPVPTLALAPGERLELRPGGRHLMLAGLRAPLVAGATLPVMLTFDHAGVLAARLVIGDGPAPATATGAHVRTPQRIITLAPHLTELVYAAGAGDRLVGTIDMSDFPAAARQVPRIGDVGRLDPERLLAARPDLVLLWGDGSPADQRALLTRLGLPVLSLEQHSLADVPATLEQLGRVFGTESVAGAAARALTAQLDGLRRRYGGARRLKVFYQVWSTPLYTLGGHHVATEMLRICGADNVFGDQVASAFVVDEESVYARDPDVVALAGTPTETAEWLRRWQGRVPLRAIANGNVITLDPDLVNRMGPRIVQGTEELCTKLAARRASLDAAPRR